jgi:CHASE2 domain-containing sensor protein
MNRFYVFKMNWLSQFGMSICFFWAALLLLLVILQPRQNTLTAELLCGVGMLLCGYLSIGAFLNGKRMFVAWFQLKFSWKNNNP